MIGNSGFLRTTVSSRWLRSLALSCYGPSSRKATKNANRWSQDGEEAEGARQAARDASRGAHLTAARAAGPCVPIDKEAGAAGAPGRGWEGRGSGARPALGPALTRPRTRPSRAAGGLWGGHWGRGNCTARASPPADASPGARAPPPLPPLPVPGARRAALLTSAGGRRCGVRRAAGALARCARPLPRPGCGARARSPSLHFFLSSLPASLSRCLSLPLELPTARGSLALSLSAVGSPERCDPWETATPPPARDLPPGPAPCPALPSARGSVKAPRTHRRLKTGDAHALAAPPNSLPPHPAPPPPPPPAATAEGATLPPTPPSAGSRAAPASTIILFWVVHKPQCLQPAPPRTAGASCLGFGAPAPATLAWTPPEPRQLPRVSAARILLAAVFFWGSGFPTFLFSAKGRIS